MSPYDVDPGNVKQLDQGVSSVKENHYLFKNIIGKFRDP